MKKRERERAKESGVFRREKLLENGKFFLLEMGGFVFLPKNREDRRGRVF